MIVLPADHWVADAKAFRNTIRAAVEIAARHDSLITIGIRPDYPETGYGYIVKGKSAWRREDRLYQVKRFNEKPSLISAQQLIRQGSLWNSGIFVWKASLLLELLRRYQPDDFKGLEQIKQSYRRKIRSEIPTRSTAHVIAREYKKMPNISIDYAVLEKAGSEGKVMTVEADFGWSDVGSWAAVHRMMPQDRARQCWQRQWLTFGAKNCLIHAAGSLGRAIGHRRTPSSSTHLTPCWSAISSAPKRSASWWMSSTRKATALTRSNSARFRRFPPFHRGYKNLRGPFQDNEPVVLLDRKDREYLSRLDQRRPIAIRGGKISVDDIIGHDEGSVVRSSYNEPFLVFRPSLPQFIPNLPRIGASDLSQRSGPDFDLGRSFSRRARRRSRRRRRRTQHGAAARHRRRRPAVLLRDSRRFRRAGAEKRRALFRSGAQLAVNLGDVAAALDETEIDRVILGFARAVARHRAGVESSAPRRHIALLLADGTSGEKFGRCAARRQAIRLHRDHPKR